MSEQDARGPEDDDKPRRRSPFNRQASGLQSPLDAVYQAAAVEWLGKQCHGALLLGLASDVVPRERRDQDDRQRVAIRSNAALKFQSAHSRQLNVAD